MKRSILTIIIATVCTCCTFAQVKAVYLEETELLSIVSHLAKVSGYDWDAEDVGVDDYLADVDNTFAAYRNHPIISFVQDELAKRGFAWHFPMHVALRLHIVDGKIEYSTDLQPDFDDYYDYISKENEEKFLALLEDFYQVSHFHDFFMAHQSVYTECENAMQHVIDQIDFRWYDTFFGPRKGGTFHIYPNILIGPANYAVHQKENSGAEIINAVMGCCLQDSNGEISYDTYSTLPIIIHECNHSFCNPLNEEFWPQLQTTMDAFYAANAQHYKDEAYGGAQYVLNETFVEACVMRYLKTHPFDFSENIERWQQVLKISDEQLANAMDRIALLNDTYINLLTKIDDEDKRFFMIRDVIKVLEEREQNQEAYPTMHDFMPRYIETINAYK